MAFKENFKLFKTTYLKFVHRRTLYNSQCTINYKNTLLLPRTKFLHKINPNNRRERDRAIESEANFKELYNRQLNRNDAFPFILHDGPPYANGNVHIGHSVNKILKDITLRYQLLKGRRVHFVPGWDCHGLPIELKVLKENNSKESQLKIRKKAHTFSQKTKAEQMASFKEWGVLADWQNSYYTCDPNYIVQQLKLFQDLYDNGVIFRDYKPVYWSPQNRTSLAEAELDYCTDHVSTSAYVKFNICNCPDFIKNIAGLNSKLYIVIWTTTPWTLPANQCVCFSADKRYCVVLNKSKGEFYLIAEETVQTLEKSIKAELKILNSFEGSALKDVSYYHPIKSNKICPLLSSSHVTMEKGTGLVHSAPNHGFDDYVVAQKQALALDPCIVGEDGCYTVEAGEQFSGKFVLIEGNTYVTNLLKNDILSLEEYVHSYPYDWRSKTPVIIRSCHQWFINVHQIKDKAISCLQNVKIIPEHLKKVFQTQIESSPQWCISRQRSWGVPIPAFYSSEDMENPIIHRLLTENLCSLIQSKDIHCWWELNCEQLFPQTIKKQLNLKEDISYMKSTDIMDIWLDSGLSWRCTLPEPYVSDIVIEGIDQIRGWFYSSLLTSVALQGKAPYNSIFLHGFTTDSEGRKMSKSEGNVIDPSDIVSGNKKNGMPAYGIDVLRWWVSAHASHSENTPIKNQILEECAQNINKLRNVFKFLLSNLDCFELGCIKDTAEMRALDVFMLHKVLQFSEKIKIQYDSLYYKNVAKELVNFVTNDVSSFYCAIAKDRLYCDALSSKERLHSQTVLNMILNTLIQCVAPICPHLASEVCLHHPDKKLAEQSVFMAKFPCLKSFLSDVPYPHFMETAMGIKTSILKSEIKMLNSEITISCNPAILHDLQKINENTLNNSGLVEFFQSDVSLKENLSSSETSMLRGEIEQLKDCEYFINIKEGEFGKCPRCRLYKTDSTNSLCQRCDNVINMVKSKCAVI